MSDTAWSRGQDLRVIGLVGTVHATSHFFQLVLPPLFPVRKEWMARAYGVHQLGGNLGWAVAPVAVLTLTHLFGWRSALVLLGLFGYLLLAIVWWQGKTLA